MSEPSIFSEEFLHDVNAVLHSAEQAPIGAYCMGILTAAAAERGLALPDRAALERAMRCTSVEEGRELAQEWVEEQLESR